MSLLRSFLLPPTSTGQSVRLLYPHQSTLWQRFVVTPVPSSPTLSASLSLSTTRIALSSTATPEQTEKSQPQPQLGADLPLSTTIRTFANGIQWIDIKGHSVSFIGSQAESNIKRSMAVERLQRYLSNTAQWAYSGRPPRSPAGGTKRTPHKDFNAAARPLLESYSVDRFTLRQSAQRQALPRVLTKKEDEISAVFRFVTSQANVYGRLHRSPESDDDAEHAQQSHADDQAEEATSPFMQPQVTLWTRRTDPGAATKGAPEPQPSSAGGSTKLGKAGSGGGKEKRDACPLHHQRLVGSSAISKAAAPEMPTGDELRTIEQTTDRITVICLPRHLITVHRGSALFIQDLQNNWEVYKHYSPALLVNNIVKHCSYTFTRAAQEEMRLLDAMEAQVLLNSNGKPLPSQGLELLYGVIRRASIHCRVMAPMKQVHAQLMDALGVSPNDIYAQDVRWHLTTAHVQNEDVRDSTQSLISLHFQRCSYELETLMRYLTVFSVFFVPLNFITALFGMNVDWLPWMKEDAGIWKCTTLLFCLSIVSLTWFGFRGYL